MPTTTPRPAPASKTADTHVARKIDAGRPGTKRYQRQFGDALVCVRYRHDPITAKRYTTVEIVVDERQLPNPVQPQGVGKQETVAVRIEFGETDLRQRAKQSGGRWDASRKVWLMPFQVAQQLGLQGRVRKVG